MTDPIREAAARVAALGESTPRQAPDPVNLPMIRHWVEAIGDTNPIYVDEVAAERSVHGGLVAPPAMAQVWTMYGLKGTRQDDDPLGAMTEILNEAGYTSVVATNCEQCGACKALRHPARVGCPQCGALQPRYVVLSGRGEVYSYMVHLHPPVPGKTLPFLIALVELKEGVRVLAELESGDVRVSMPV